MSTEMTNNPEEGIAIVSTSKAVDTAPRLRLLSGPELGEGEFSSPSAPWFTGNGRIRIYGTASYCLEYASWDHLLANDGPKAEAITLLAPDGSRIEGAQSAWDITPYRWRDEEGETTWLYAAVMTPRGSRKIAHFPHDNQSRRIYAFRSDGEGRWIRQRLPLFGALPTAGWLGQSFGHHFIDDVLGNTWVFYQRVVVEQRNAAGQLVPYQTEVFARKMLAPYRAADEEVGILDAGSPPYPSALRQEIDAKSHNGFVVGGPRPIKAVIQGEAFYLLGFSSGDPRAERYGINLAWSRNMKGPYIPLLNASASGLDLLDLGAEIRTRYGLACGPARPSFFQDPYRRWWVLFHAAPKEPKAGGQRQIYLAPVKLGLSETGTPEVKILDGDAL